MYDELDEERGMRGLTHMAYSTGHRSGRARSPKRAAGPSRAMRPEPRYEDEMGYMRALGKGLFAEDVRRPIRLSQLRFFSNLLDTCRYDRRFPSRFEDLRPTSTPISGFPTGHDLPIAPSRM
jgi:hypothetical protein